MKKNWTLRVGAALCALTLMTSSFVGGTFAKYVTNGEGSDSARVAKWGVEVKATGTTFAKEYATHDQGVTIAKSVISADNVVAPGTAGDMAGIELRGTPEVAVRVSYTADLELGNNWIDNVDTSKLYFPIIFTINGQHYSASGTNCASADEFETYIENKIAEYTKEYGPGTDLSNWSNDNLTVSWSWPFETGNDDKDTFLGDRAAAEVGNAGTIDLTVTATVTQID